jgi:single-stranded DNA-binding protein
LNQVNRLWYEGRIISTPIIRDVGDKRVCNFRVLNTTNDGKKERHLALDCTAWEEMAEKMTTAKQGDVVAVTGDLRTFAWSKDGEEIRGIELNCEEILHGGLGREK